MTIQTSETSHRLPVLDHGYVEFIEAWGQGKVGQTEAGIIEAARQSTQGSFRGWEADEKLLRFLFTNKPQHATPFEFAGMVIEVQAPIFVFREWHRHRTQSYNEMSARYAPLPDLYYLPQPMNVWERSCAAATSKNRQAGTTVVADQDTCDAWVKSLTPFYQLAEKQYQDALSEGIPKELARITMPVAHYSRMRASATLRNWLAFLTLRLDPNAQWEIRQFANAVGVCVAEHFPHTWRLFRPPVTEVGTRSG